MKRILATAVAGAALALPLGLATAGTAAAAPTTGAQCAQDGVSFLRSQGLLQAAASRQIDYSLLGPEAPDLLPSGEANPFKGLIVPQLAEGSFLPLGQVVKLHITHPEFFPAWC